MQRVSILAVVPALCLAMSACEPDRPPEPEPKPVVEQQAPPPSPPPPPEPDRTLGNAIGGLVDGAIDEGRQRLEDAEADLVDEIEGRIPGR